MCCRSAAIVNGSSEMTRPLAFCLRPEVPVGGEV